MRSVPKPVSRGSGATRFRRTDASGDRTSADSRRDASSRRKGSWLYDPKVRGLVYQVVLVVVVIFLFYCGRDQRDRQPAPGEHRLRLRLPRNTAGFDISQTLIPFTAAGSTYGHAFIVGLLNTLLVAAIGIVLATFLGFLVGIARLSKNWIVAKLAMVYVEVIRNIPLLLQLLFWYNAVLTPLPQPRKSIELGAGIFLNYARPVHAAAALRRRRLGDPRRLRSSASSGASSSAVWAKRQQEATGQQYPVGLVGARRSSSACRSWSGSCWRSPAANPITFDVPSRARFNLRGGMQILPGVRRAAARPRDLHRRLHRRGRARRHPRRLAAARRRPPARSACSPGQTLRLVVIPQAMRVIIPPLTSQYLNLTKNSSLAVAIGYPDLVQVFMGTVLNQTGQAIEVVGITMAVYLTISLSPRSS